MVTALAAEGAEVPHLIQQLSAHRALGGLRTVLAGCSLPAATLREGPARDDGPGAAWLEFLCPAHSQDLPAWPAAATHPDDGSMPCGTVLDYRTAEQQLQSHADLWLTTLTGVDPQALGYVWSDVLDQADRVLLPPGRRSRRRRRGQSAAEHAGGDGPGVPGRG